jgi:hypothetical protein
METRDYVTETREAMERSIEHSRKSLAASAIAGSRLKEFQIVLDEIFEPKPVKETDHVKLIFGWMK